MVFATIISLNEMVFETIIPLNEMVFETIILLNEMVILTTIPLNKVLWLLLNYSTEWGRICDYCLTIPLKMIFLTNA